jgi:hypothetical protein
MYISTQGMYAFPVFFPLLKFALWTGLFATFYILKAVGCPPDFIWALDKLLNQLLNFLHSVKAKGREENYASSSHWWESVDLNKMNTYKRNGRVKSGSLQAWRDKTGNNLRFWACYNLKLLKE